jgi:predicted DNA-binding transcriptional regulator AlpA
MLDKPLTRDDLESFFNLRKRGGTDRRALNKVLRALGIRLRGGTTRWSVVMEALGLAAAQDADRWAELTAPLLTASEIAQLLGLADSSIIYRWTKGAVPPGTPPFPAVIDLANGQQDARAKRWRRAEVLAWHEGRTPPRYAKAAPAFGALVSPK